MEMGLGDGVALMELIIVWVDGVLLNMTYS